VLLSRTEDVERQDREQVVAVYQDVSLPKSIRVAPSFWAVAHGSSGTISTITEPIPTTDRIAAVGRSFS
jgi:hypothetical protein